MSSFDKSGSAVKASVAAGALAVALVLALQSPTLLAQPAVQGQWRTLSYLMPINPVHVTLTNDGKVLVVAGSGNVATETNFDAVVWNPDDDSFVTHALTWDMFCNGASVLPDGRVFINGGTLQYDPFFGEPRSSAYDPATGVFSDLPNMADGRWYPTTTTLGNGSIMTFSGLKATGGTNTTVEIYTPATGWSAPVAAGWTPPLYPRMHLSTDGRVFYSGSGRGSRFFNPATMTWTAVVATTNYGNTRTYGTSVLLPLTPANQYRPRVMIFGGSNPATNTTEIIDLSAPTPQWQLGPPMSQARIEMNATILPNGKVLAMGGSASDENAATASFNADLYDPATNTFSSAGANAYPRLYHSGSLLLPDATVMLVGGNPTRGSYEQHIEIYSPAYLFNANGSRGVAADDHRCDPRRVYIRPGVSSRHTRCGEHRVGRAGPARLTDACVRHGPAAGRNVLHGEQWPAECYGAAEREHRASRLLHVVRAQRRGSAVGRPVRAPLDDAPQSASHGDHQQSHDRRHGRSGGLSLLLRERKRCGRNDQRLCLDLPGWDALVELGRDSRRDHRTRRPASTRPRSR